MERCRRSDLLQPGPLAGRQTHPRPVANRATRRGHDHVDQSRTPGSPVARALPVVRVPRFRSETSATVRRTRRNRGSCRPTQRGEMKGKPFTLPITAVLVVMFVSLPINAGAQGTDTAPGQQPPRNSTGPSISGTAVDGQTLTANAGDWSGVSVTYSYQWQRCNTSGDGCSPVDGAVDSTYGLGSSDVGSTLRIVVTASNKNGSAASVSTASGVAGPVPAPAPA